MASDTEYVFTRDFLDNNRINLMHFLWTKLFGFAIHPKIPTEATNLRVADVGTGTGIWLLDVQGSLKEAQLDGFDISFDAAPPSETLPTGVTFRHWDVRDDVPADLEGAYDIINVRFFAFVLLNDEIPRVVAKLFTLLKPGGYLQWGEPDLESLRFDRTKPESKTDNLRELFSLLSVQDPRLKPTWINHLDEIFVSNGFVEVERVTRDAPPHLAFTFHEAGLMIHEQIARKTKNERMAGELKRLLPAAVEETRLGAYITSLRYLVVGKKP
ncbi:S-adenosyl-L-methionine-dependent methyltransferase [Xylaria telfairii]|nr:S-adenosyl-L-methionine-dependent methyltransferase [Xylaria telfairii]